MITGRTIVIKLGSQVVYTENLKQGRELLARLVKQVVQLQSAGNRVIIVSSGAIAFGRLELLFSSKLTLAQKQTAAAVGQPALMSLYKELFQEHQLVVAQVLLTAEDFSNRQRYLNTLVSH